MSIAPPADDLAAVTEKKPIPTPEIATSQKAADDYSASIEAWGDRIYAAGARICRYEKKVHKLGITCPAP